MRSDQNVGSALVHVDLGGREGINKGVVVSMNVKIMPLHEDPAPKFISQAYQESL